MPTLERAVKWVWLILGGLALTGLAALAIYALTSAVDGAGETAVPAAGRQAAAPAADAPALRYDLPERIPGTGTRMVLVRRGHGARYSDSYSYSSRGAGPMVNVAFQDAAGVRLLLDRPAYIESVSYRGSAGDAPPAAADTAAPLRWIVYQMALSDANGDHRLNDRDPQSLFVTDRDGRGLRQVLPAGFAPVAWQVRADGGLDITALAPAADPRHGDDDELRQQRAFVLEPGGQVHADAQLDSALAAAARVVGQ